MIDFGQLETAWRSSANNPDRAASAYLIGAMRTTLEERRAGVRRHLVFAALALTVPLALAAFDIAQGRADAVDFTREWALIPFALIPFTVLILIWRRQKAHLERHPRVDGSLKEMFRALLDENAAARGRIHILAGAFVVFAPLLAVMVSQLGAVGKMAPAHMVQAGIIMGCGLAGGALFMALKYVVQLMPERRRLEALLSQYEAA